MYSPMQAPFYPSFLEHFGHEPNADQQQAFQMLDRYLQAQDPQTLFLLKGYAGTGKTSIIKAVSNALLQRRIKVVQLAPTGRAAKVMANYSGRTAFTIHRYIYTARTSGVGPSYQLRSNTLQDALIIVDEASMLSDNAASEMQQNLLEDLLVFVESGENCRLLLVGDTAQLPPVGQELSAALDSVYLRQRYGMQVREVELKTVMRQEQDSYILANATQLRQSMTQESIEWPKLREGVDVIRLNEGFEIEEALNAAFHDLGREECMVITRSNKRAVLYNRQIRTRIFWQEDELNAGDLLMVVKNNYYWLPENHKAAFIANGDIVELMRFYAVEELYGCRFARAEVRMIDYPDSPTFETLLLLDVLDAPTPNMSWQQQRALYAQIAEDYPDEQNAQKLQQLILRSPHYNALQVKFAYTVTCHKAQGGQWPYVFVEKPWLPSGEMDSETLRWLYTAFTRATQRLYLMGFVEAYF